MKWLSMIVVVVVTAVCITAVFGAARRAERKNMADQDRQAHPELPKTLSVLVDQQGEILELHSNGRPLQGDPGPSSWLDLEPDYDIVLERWIDDDEYGQVKLLQLQLRVKEP